MVTDPRTPQTKEAQLPDPLDQVPNDDRPEDALDPHGSEDARLFADAKAAEGDVEAAGPEASS